MPLVWEENSAWDSVLDVFIFVVYGSVWVFRFFGWFCFLFLNKQMKKGIIKQNTLSWRFLHSVSSRHKRLGSKERSSGETWIMRTFWRKTGRFWCERRGWLFDSEIGYRWNILDQPTRCCCVQTQTCISWNNCPGFGISQWWVSEETVWGFLLLYQQFLTQYVKPVKLCMRCAFCPVWTVHTNGSTNGRWMVSSN